MGALELLETFSDFDQTTSDLFENKQKAEEFFGNKNEEFNEKKAQLNIVHRAQVQSLDIDDEGADEMFNQYLYFLQTYADVTQNAHPKENMPTWWENGMKYQAKDSSLGL